MVTKGPVFWIRLESSSMTGDFIDDRWVQSAFVIGALGLIAIAWPGREPFLRDPVVAISFSVLPVLVVVSTAWSVAPDRTFEQGLMLVLGTFAALFGGAFVGRRAALVALWSSMQIGVAASIIAEVRNWPRARDPYGDLAGIYFSRNSLGPVAMIGVMSSVALILLYWRHRRGLILGLGLGAVAVVDIVVLRLSGSLTTVFAAVVAATGVAVLGLFVPGPGQHTRRRVGAVVGPVLLVLGGIVVAARSTLSEGLGRRPTFSGRTVIWDVAFDFVAEHPVRGWGFMAIWTQPDIIARLAERNNVVFEAHSGYVEILLGTGLVGLLALVVVILMAVHRTAASAWDGPGVLGFWAFGLVLYAVTVNLGETYVGANLLPWVLLLVATGQALTVRSHDR